MRAQQLLHHRDAVQSHEAPLALRVVDLEHLLQGRQRLQHRLLR